MKIKRNPENSREKRLSQVRLQSVSSLVTLSDSHTAATEHNMQKFFVKNKRVGWCLGGKKIGAQNVFTASTYALRVHFSE